VKYVLSVVLCLSALVSVVALNRAQLVTVKLSDPCDLDNHSPTDWVEINSNAPSDDAIDITEANAHLQEAGVCVLDITSYTRATFQIFYRAEIPISQVSLAIDDGWDYTPRDRRIVEMMEARAWFQDKITELETELKTAQKEFNSAEGERERTVLTLTIDTKRAFIKEATRELESFDEQIEHVKNHETPYSNQ